MTYDTFGLKSVRFQLSAKSTFLQSLLEFRLEIPMDKFIIKFAISVFVVPALAVCDICVQFYVRQAVRPSFRSQFTPTLAFKFI